MGSSRIYIEQRKSRRRNRGKETIKNMTNKRKLNSGKTALDGLERLTRCLPRVIRHQLSRDHVIRLSQRVRPFHRPPFSARAASVCRLSTMPRHPRSPLRKEESKRKKTENKPSARIMPPKLLLASEVVAFTDAELDRYLEANRLPNGDRMVEVEDPDNLPESFIQRLRFDLEFIYLCYMLNLTDSGNKLSGTAPVRMPPSPSTSTRSLPASSSQRRHTAALLRPRAQILPAR